MASEPGKLKESHAVGGLYIGHHSSGLAVFLFSSEGAICVFTSSAIPFHWEGTANLEGSGAHWKLASSESGSSAREKRDEQTDCSPGWEVFVEEKQPVPGSLPP